MYVLLFRPVFLNENAICLSWKCFVKLSSILACFSFQHLLNKFKIKFAAVEYLHIDLLLLLRVLKLIIIRGKDMTSLTSSFSVVQKSGNKF